MRLSNFILGIAAFLSLGAGSLQASILQNTSGLSGIYSVAFDQTFVNSAPYLRPGQPPVNPATPTVFPGSLITNQFNYLTVSSNALSSGLYYNPNGAQNGNCTAGNGTVATPNIAPNCLGGFIDDTSGFETMPATVGGALYSFTVTFDNPQNEAAFVLASNYSAGNNTQFVVKDINGNVLETDQVHTALTSRSQPLNYFVFYGTSAPISSISISALLPSSSFTPFGSYSPLISNIEGSTTPEPGTMALFGLGLLSIAYLARRRKA